MKVEIDKTNKIWKLLLIMMKKPKTKITKKKVGGWIYYLNLSKKNQKQNIYGKYLFFSEDKDLLDRVAIEELSKNNFYLAKLIVEDAKISDDFVLCIYYKDDSRKKELYEKYKNKEGIKYRWWKSDKDTVEGKYSKKFLSFLSPKEKKMLQLRNNLFLNEKDFENWDVQ